MQRDTIHERFLEYYEKLGFQISYRAPMLHPSVPMSFVMSAGLVQIELGLTQLDVNADAPPPPSILIQTCFRHFDIHKIGERNSHLTLFEMPGAFIFGAENRQRLLRWQWEFVTEELAIPRQHIWATYFEGGQLGLHDLPPDTESYATWRSLGLPPERVVGNGIDGNYWQQGGSVAEDPTRRRKCGPQTELFYDRGEELRCGANCTPGCACGRFVEFSNTLFISHEFDSIRGELIPLPMPFSETVIGTERVAMILQGTPSVFDTSEFLPLMTAVQTRFPSPPNDDEAGMHLRVIVDHLRSIYVLLSEGAPPPGKNGRARIIRVLMRNIMTRMMLLGADEPGEIDVLLAPVRAHVAHLVIEADATETKFRAYFAQEVVRFMTTVRQGIQELCKLVDVNDGGTLTGVQITFLEKKLGLPYLLIRKQLDEMHLLFDEEGYQAALKETPPSSSLPTRATASVNEGEAAMVLETVKSQLTEFLRDAVKVLGADLATLYLYDGDWDQLYYPVAVNLSTEHKIEFERSVPDMDRVPGRIVRMKTPIFETDVLRGTMAGPFSIRENIRSAAALPLLDANDEVIGTVFFNYRRAQTFPAADRDAISATTQTLAQRVEAEVKRHPGFSLDTESVAAHMLEQRELTIIEETLTAADAAIRDTHLTFMLLDKEHKALRSISSPKINPMLADFALPLDQSNFVVDAFRDSRELMLHDVSRAGSLAIAERADQLRWLTGFAVPLIAGRSTLGVLCAFAIDHSGFTDTEQELLRSYARQVALQIDSERRIDSMTALNSLATRLASVTDVETALRALMSAILRILRADVVSIDMYNPVQLAFDQSYTRDLLEEGIDFEKHEPPRVPTPIEETVLGLGAVPTILDTWDTNPEYVNDFVRQYAIRSYTAMPLRYRDVKLGMIYVNSRSPHAFTGEDIRQIKNVVTFASNALYTAWINQKRNTARSLMADFAQKTKNTPLEPLIDHMLREIAALFDSEVSSLGFFDPRSDYIEFRYAFGEQKGYRQHLEIGLVGEAFKQQQPVATGDAHADTRYSANNPFTQSEMDIPLIVEDRVIAILNLESKRLDAYNEDLQRLAATVAAQVAPLLYTLQLREREQVLEEFGREIRLGINLTEPEIIERVASLAQRIQLDTKDFYMGLYDDIAGEFRYVNVIKDGQRLDVSEIQNPKRAEALQSWRPRRDGQHRADWVVQHNKSLCHLSREDGIAWYESHRGGFIPPKVSPSWIGVPINSGKHELQPDLVSVRGVIVIQDDDKPNAFADSDEHVLQLLANLVGIALYNSRLYNDVTQRYRTLADVLEKITQNLSATEEEMFSLFHHATEEHIPALQNMYIALYDRVDDQIRFPYTVINGERKTVVARGFKRGKGSWGRTEHLIDEAMKHNVERLLHNTKEESRKWYEGYGHKDHLGNQPFSSYLGVPIRLGTRIFGVLAVYDDNREHVYGENEFHLLNSLARILAIVLEAREKREQQRAESAFTALGLSSTIILHRLRNLIAPITLDVMRLQPRIPAGNEEVEKLLTKIDSAADNSVKIISKLADQVRDEESEPQDIVSRLQEIVETTQETYPLIRLHNNVTDDLPLVEAPTLFVSEIFTNLIENACRAMPDGGDVYVDLDRDADPDFITISVADTGSGVPEHLQKKLFTKPMPYSNQKSSERQTLGLGLYLTYLQIRKLGGNLRYMSKEHRNPDEPQGAKFVVEFPVKQEVE